MTKEELEKEAEEWTKDHSGLIGSYKFVKYDYDSMQKAYLAGAEPREKRIEELEKENAELKGIKDVATLIRANNDTVTTLMQLNNNLVSKRQQLTKAKEIIKTLLLIADNKVSQMEFQLCVADAKQFLNSEVEK